MQIVYAGVDDGDDDPTCITRLFEVGAHRLEVGLLSVQRIIGNGTEPTQEVRLGGIDGVELGVG